MIARIGSVPACVMSVCFLFYATCIMVSEKSIKTRNWRSLWAKNTPHLAIGSQPLGSAPLPTTHNHIHVQYIESHSYCIDNIDCHFDGKSIIGGQSNSGYRTHLIDLWHLCHHTTNGPTCLLAERIIKQRAWLCRSLMASARCEAHLPYTHSCTMHSIDRFEWWIIQNRCKLRPEWV